MSNNQLPTHVQQLINKDAIISATSIVSEYEVGDLSTTEIALREHQLGYIAGATAWAMWKQKYDELNAQPGPVWVKASEKLPLHKAFWNIEDGFKKDCSFPVRIDGKHYGIGDLYDNRKEGAPDPIYYFVIKGNPGEYYSDSFHRFEWLDDQPQLNLPPLNIPNPNSFDLGEMFGIPPMRLQQLSKKLDGIVSKGETKIIYASEVIRKIEAFCVTREEFIWCIFNHLIWLGKRGALLDENNIQAAINKFGEPKKM